MRLALNKTRIARVSAICDNSHGGEILSKKVKKKGKKPAK